MAEVVVLGILLLSLLGIGATAGLITEFRDDDDDNNFFQPPRPGGDTDPPADTPDTGLTDLLIGTDGDDVIDGSNTPTINAGAGDDIVTGGAGPDSISGDAGNDRLSGLAGDDVLAGGDGNDSLFGSDGEDLAFGGAGDDLIWGGSDDDLLVGGPGTDTLMGSSGDDILIGTLTPFDSSSATDIATALTESGVTLTSLGVFSPNGDTDDGDALMGGFGDDVLLIGSQDTATGGDGSDVFTLGTWIQSGSSAVIQDYDPADDEIIVVHEGSAPALTIVDDGATNALIQLDGTTIASVTGAAATLSLANVSLVSVGPDGGPAGETQTGSPGPDNLEGGASDDLIVGDAGNDTITALAGNDILRGGTGDDLIDAGADDDRVFGNDGADTILGGAGNDFLRGSDGNDQIIDAEGADIIFGDLGDDVIMGSAFGDPTTPAALDFSTDTDTVGDQLDGGIGNDTIYAGLDDTLTGGDGNDTFVTSDIVAGATNITITDFDITQDVLFISVDPAAPSVLSITYSTGATPTSGDASVLLDGDLVALVQGVGTSFGAPDVALQPRI